MKHAKSCKKTTKNFQSGKNATIKDGFVSKKKQLLHKSLIIDKMPPMF